MKKYTFALALAALMPFVSADAYEYSQTKSGYYKAPIAKTSSYKKASNTRKTGGYKNVITNNFYYGETPKYYKTSAKANNYYTGAKEQEAVVKKSYKSQMRKYFLAHPFFQPLQGKVGSVTDFSYAQNRFSFDMLNGSVYGINPLQGPVSGELPIILSGKAETQQFVIKEDLSFGLTDTLALMLMAQYDSTKVTFKDWSEPSEGSNSKSDSGLNLFGIGLQNRFIDTDDWIVMGDALYQHQKDTANIFMAEVKAGYKINKTTIYGLGRLSYTNLTQGDAYGAYVDDNGDWLMLSYKTDVKDIFMAEGGIGAFAVLGKYFSLNGEMTYGSYNWHNQLNIKGAFGWQPADMFALNVYASTVLYDSAKNSTQKYMNYNAHPENPADYPKDINGNPLFTDSTALYTIGDYKIKDYNEWKIGVQAILYF